MVNINNMDIEQLVKFINIELSKNKSLSVNKFCELNDIKKSTLKSRMSRGNYSYNADLRKYIKDNTTSNTTEVLQEVSVLLGHGEDRMELMRQYVLDIK